MPSGIISPWDLPARAPRPAAHRSGLMLKARVWLHDLELDAALAGGADPAQSEQLDLRAKQLAERKTRERLASEISRLIGIVDGSNRPALTTRVAPFRRKQAQANRSLLLELEQRLRAYKPVALRGLALTSLMLEDGDGPLRIDSHPATLERAIRAALSALEVDTNRPQEAPSQLGMSA